MDQARLARVFGVSPPRTTLAVVATSTLALIGLATPVGWIAGAGVVAGMGGGALVRRRSVAKGLRELDGWGFPVEGYREWLLADEPTFDVELARDVDIDVIAQSLRALDAAIIVENRGERRFRVITRRIALPSVKRYQPAIYAGDRRLLHELHERVLAPLHADVGIRIMRMGERAKLPLLLASGPAVASTAGDHSMGAFRDAALVAPPALQALVHDGLTRELPHEARKLDRRIDRVVYASGSSPYGVGTVLGLSGAGASAGIGYHPIYGLAVGAIAGAVIGIGTTIERNRRNANRVAAVYDQPFTIDGYDDWLLSGRPLLDIEMHSPCDRGWLRDELAKLKAFSVGINASVPWVEDVYFFDDKYVRIETRPTLIEPPTSRIRPFYGGSYLMFGELVQLVLVPLHRNTGIVAVRMGGYINRRI